MVLQYEIMIIENRISKIQQAFQAGKKEAEERGLQPFYNFETDLHDSLISVGFEGCSMGIALNSLKTKNSLIDWHLFVANSKPNYYSQIHVGLGWALAELKTPTSSHLIGIDPKWQLRVLDGYGYYCGFFRRKEVIRQMNVPKEILNEQLGGFDQGLGRFLFYRSQGEIEILKRQIDLFPEERHADLWRGIGIAICFISSSSNESIEDLKALGDQHLNSLSTGAALAANSMQNAGLFSGRAKEVVLLMLNNKQEIHQKTQKLENKQFHSFSEFYIELIKLS